jgi:alkylation response protein AidB-like acyl-CoA dehydrogenase
MRVDLTTEQRQLRNEIRTYFRSLMTDDALAAWRREQTDGTEAGPVYKGLIHRMASDGWLAVGWPAAYGGRGYGPVEQLIFLEEAQRATAPYPFVTVNTVGPALMAHGSPAHKTQFLPGIARGETHFAIGYTEADAGTDLAALRTSAVRDGDSFVVNGAKVYTSHVEGADFIWLACRTDPAAAKHKGISILIVDTKLPGFSFAPLHTVGGMRTNFTYYDSVRVPADMLVGELNHGWSLITSQLNHERVGLAARGALGEELSARALAWARASGGNGRRPIDDPAVRHLFGELHARLEGLRLLNYRLAWSASQNQPDPAFASAAKVHGTECMIEVCRMLLEILGTGGLVRRGSAAALLAGDVEEYYRRCQINTFGGGSVEVLREIVAQLGLGMPRTVR